eukprot:5627179-Pleurochrysis_carterae.AAC.1
MKALASFSGLPSTFATEHPAARTANRGDVPSASLAATLRQSSTALLGAHRVRPSWKWPPRPPPRHHGYRPAHRVGCATVFTLTAAPLRRSNATGATKAHSKPAFAPDATNGAMLITLALHIDVAHRIANGESHGASIRAPSLPDTTASLHLSPSPLPADSSSPQPATP